MIASYEHYFEKLRQEKMVDYELLVVINNTSDNTPTLLKHLHARNKRIRYLTFQQGGKGFALIEGFKDALTRPNELIGFVDADLATPPAAFYDLIRCMGAHSGVIAARWRRDSIVKKQPFLATLKSFIFNILVRSLFLFPYSDTQCGAKLFQRRAIEYVHAKMSITKWAFDIDLLYKLRKGGFSVIEIPTIWENKEDSRLKVINASVEMFLAVIRLRLIHSSFNFIVRAYDALPQYLKVHHRIWT